MLRQLAANLAEGAFPPKLYDSNGNAAGFFRLEKDGAA
jgi:hypothetical protein